MGMTAAGVMMTGAMMTGATATTGIGTIGAENQKRTADRKTMDHQLRSWMLSVSVMAFFGCCKTQPGGIEFSLPDSGNTIRACAWQSEICIPAPIDISIYCLSLAVDAAPTGRGA